MMSFIDTLSVIGMFLLRVGVPLAVTAGLVYLLKRLDRRWEEEARAEQRAHEAAGMPAEQPALPQPAERPEAPKRAPAPEIPFIPPPAYPDRRQQPGLGAQAGQVAQRSSNAKGSSADKVAKCGAPQRPDQPCWQARLAAEGHIPEECVSCDIFQRYPVM